MSYSSTISTSGGNDDDADYVYYNADIINNTTIDQSATGVAITDPAIRFTETRDKPIIKDSSQYHFSIIRFTMDGPNKDLPLFIPQIQEGTGQTNPNLTVYGMAFPFTGTYTSPTAAFPPIPLTVLPPTRFIQYQSETKNTNVAPVPAGLQNTSFKGEWSNTTVYNSDAVVARTLTQAQSAFLLKYNSYQGPFYAPKTQAKWESSQTYGIGAAVLYNDLIYVANAVNGPSIVAPSVSPSWTLGLPVGVPPETSIYWKTLTTNTGNTQDIAIFDINEEALPALDPLGNPTVFNCCWGDLYQAIYLNLLATNALAAAQFATSYPTLGLFAGLFTTADPNYVAYPPPRMEFNPDTNRFSIQASSICFGYKTQNAVFPAAGFANTGVVRMFVNSNMFGLFTNFSNLYWNTLSNTIGPFPGFVAPVGYVNEILFPNHLFQNLRTLPAIAPALWAAAEWWVIDQDYNSNDSLWSPVSSIVFTSTLLPIVKEATGVPVKLGQGNIGNSTATIQSGFEPIITDIALDTSIAGAQAYRRYTIYLPSAEYRLSDFGPSRQEIRTIDINVFWKSRLDNRLYPIYMFNLSAVSIKAMFKHIRTM
jgi:hypothetical protein